MGTMREEEGVSMECTQTGVLDSALVRRRRSIRLVPALAIAGTLLLACAARATAAEAKLTFIDLQGKANQNLSEDLHEAQGNNLENVPRGEQKMAGTSFKIGEKMIHLKSEHVEDAPEKVEAITVDGTFDRLHILHSTGYGEVEPLMEDGTEIGAYVVHYADKTTERIPIVYGEDVRDWYDWNRIDVKRGKIAWTGTNAASEGNQRHIRLFALDWNNPHPEKTVATIDVESKVTQCDPFVLAITLEKKG
jgi:hypothetical protein